MRNPRRRRARWKLLFYVDEAPDIAAPLRDIFESGGLDPLVGHPEVVVLVQRSQPGKRQPTIRYVLGERPRSLGEVGQMRSRTLEGFLEWQKRFPAEHTILIVLGHGDGWEGILWNDEEKAWITLPAFAEAMRRADVRPDILDIDACHLAGLELVEFEGIADFAIASELFIPAESQDYAALARLLARRPRITPLELGRAILAQYREAYGAAGPKSDGVGEQPLGFTLFRLARAPEVVYHMAVLSLDFRKAGVSPRTLRRRLTYCLELGRWRDLVEFLEGVVARFRHDNPRLARRASRVLDLLRPHQEGFVVDVQSVNARSFLHGVLVELSAPGETPAIEEPAYERLRFEKIANWRGFLRPPNATKRSRRKRRAIRKRC